jgi:Superinfection immunity protein
VNHALAASLGGISALSAGLYLVALAAYFVPTFVALTRRGAAPTGTIVVVNIFLGWSVIGWIVALTLACRTRAQYKMPADWTPPTPRSEWMPPQQQRQQQRQRPSTR